MKLAIFKNTNTKKSKYPIICISSVRFPFKYTRKLYLTTNEVDRLKALLERMPEVKVEQDKKEDKAK